MTAIVAKRLRDLYHLRAMRTLFLSAIICALSGMAQPVPMPSRVPATVTSNAQKTPFFFGEVLAFRSRALNEDRALNVHLPEGYSPDSSTAYPVIYVLDGSANEDFPHIAGLAQFMNMYDLLPKSIVVGIANAGPSRYRDFTSPSKVDSDMVWIPTNGGFAAFLDFLENEVQPLVMKQYRTNGQRTIIGQSLGGLFGMEVLFTKPNLFDDYILVSPSLWWSGGSLAANADAWVKANATAPKRIFIAAALDDAMMQKEIDLVIAAFTAHAEQPMQWIHVPFPEESHATILHRAVYRAFEWLTSGK